MPQYRYTYKESVEQSAINNKTWKIPKSLRNPESSYLFAETLPPSQRLNDYKYMKLYKKTSYISEICEVSFFIHPSN